MFSISLLYSTRINFFRINYCHCIRKLLYYKEIESIDNLSDHLPIVLHYILIVILNVKLKLKLITNKYLSRNM